MRFADSLRHLCAWRCAAWLLVAAAGVLASLAEAASSKGPGQPAAQRTAFTDTEILDGFLKITFGAELHTAGRVDRIRKFDGPVRVFIDNRARPDRSAQAARTVLDIGDRIQHLDVTIAPRRAGANMVVTLVRDDDLDRTIRSIYGREHARRIQRSLDPQCLSGFRKDEEFRIQHAEVILVSDAGDMIFRDCAYEEILQALGPINDDASVPWTMFNDDVQLGFFGVYDQFILNLLYHPRIRPGMTRAEVEALAPEILPEVRAFVAKVNKLPP